MRPAAICLFLLCVFGALPAQQPDQPALTGFTADHSKAELDLEKRFQAIPDPARMRASMELLSARPHHVGSPYDKQNAEWILARYKEWGWDAHIETFNVLFPTPKTRLLEMGSFRARLQEPTLAVDPTSGQKDEQLPTYNAYSPDGNVTAPLVYVNYGLVEDYEQLARYGISVKGAIVLARYGHSWRGIKPKLAAAHGALACIIYSDPADDGYTQDAVFPDGPMRPADGVQRGSVLDAPLYPGDPLTPGVGATPDAQRLKLEDAASLARTPTLPISYADAQPLLAALQGPVAPEQWRGALPITYRIGPTATPVHLQLAFNWDLKPVYDVIATMRGTDQPDQWILRANHHDGWVNGAEDPTSGQVALLEEARALGELARTGWKPKRTIMYMSWDGEEPMLLGSTEWGEQHAEELRKHAAIYINSDGNGRGYLSAQGSHTLEPLVNDVARTIQDPETKASVWKRWQAACILYASPEDRKDCSARNDLRIGALGSGSDFSVFLDHLGIASLDISYGGEDEGGIYHSIYDDFYWYTHFSDTTFVYGRAMAQTDGTLVLRMAQADLLPYDFTSLADTLRLYTGQLKTLLETRRTQAADRKAALDASAYALTSDPRRPTIAPPALETPPFLNFAPLDNALTALDAASAHYAKACIAADGKTLPDALLKSVNEELIQAERKLTSPQGLPRRPWMEHLIYAPGWFTGYDAKTLPGPREAIEERRYSDADPEIARVAQAINAEAQTVERLATELDSALN